MKLKNASSYLCWYKIMKVELRAIEIKRFHYENGREPLFNSSIYNVCSVESLTVNAGTLGMGNATEMAGEKTCIQRASLFVVSLDKACYQYSALLQLFFVHVDFDEPTQQLHVLLLNATLHGGVRFLVNSCPLGLFASMQLSTL